MALEIELYAAGTDNIGYLLRDAASGRVAAIDSPSATAMRAALSARKWRLTDIIITHHHFDHVDGLEGLKSEFECRLVGPQAESDRIWGLDELVSYGDTVELGGTRLAVIDTPGHTLGHVVYHDRESRALFSGDALFSVGVGRMLEGTPGPMWKGLTRLKALPGDTLLYCGHEYTLSNIAFALSVDPRNAALQARRAEAEAQRAAGRFTVPVTLATEFATNPFLRADTPELAAAAGLVGADPVEVFAALRRMKDGFRG